MIYLLPTRENKFYDAARFTATFVSLSCKSSRENISYLSIPHYYTLRRSLLLPCSRLSRIDYIYILIIKSVEPLVRIRRERRDSQRVQALGGSCEHESRILYARIFERESRSRGIGIAVSAPEPVLRPSMPFPRLASFPLPFPSLLSSPLSPVLHARRSLLHFFHQKRFRKAEREREREKVCARARLLCGAAHFTSPRQR